MSAAPLPPAPWRPGAPRTLGTLAVVFGWITATFAAMTLLNGGRVGGTSDDNFPAEALAAFTDATQAANLGLNLILITMSVTLVFIGAGLRRYERWAGRAAARWSLGALVLVGAIAYVNGVVIGPAAEALFATADDRELAEMAPAMRWAGLGSVAIYAPFPIVLVAFLRRARFVAALDQPRRT